MKIVEHIGYKAKIQAYLKKHFATKSVFSGDHSGWYRRFNRDLRQYPMYCQRLLFNNPKDVRLLFYGICWFVLSSFQNADCMRNRKFFWMKSGRKAVLLIYGITILRPSHACILHYSKVNFPFKSIFWTL